MKRADVLARVRAMHAKVEAEPYLIPKSDIFDFGKYKGRKAVDVAGDDPGYIVWCWDNIKPRDTLPFNKVLYEECWMTVEERCEQETIFLEEAYGFDR